MPTEVKVQACNQCKKHKITAKKFEGDDRDSWAVFVDGVPAVTGLNHRLVPYYKDTVRESLHRKHEGV